MLKREALWISDVLTQFDSTELSPILNVGSSTAEFRTCVQPWIEESIFVPLRSRGIIVHHLDMRDGDGIDLHGDLSDDAFVSKLRHSGYQTVLCCNVLEHVAHPAAICAQLERLVPSGGHIVVTVPNRFPYHPDPIDTMLRPDVQQILALFPGSNLVDGAILECGTGWDYVDRNPRTVMLKVKRRLSRLRENGGVAGTTSFLPWLFRHFFQTCVLLQKQRVATQPIHTP